MEVLMAHGTENNNDPTAADKAYEYLKTAILSGLFPPGERLVEEKLAKEAGVSRTPIRSALGRLATEGFIKPLEKRGYFIPRDSLEEMDEVFDLRAVLEGYALALAVPRVTGGVLQELTEYVRLAQKALETGENQQVFRWNTAFHDTLNDLIADKTRLYNLIADMRKYVLRYRKDTLHYIKGAEHSIEGHRRIIHALRLGYPDLCERVMREHVMEAKEDARSTILENK